MKVRQNMKMTKASSGEVLGYKKTRYVDGVEQIVQIIYYDDVITVLRFQFSNKEWNRFRIKW